MFPKFINQHISYSYYKSIKMPMDQLTILSTDQKRVSMILLIYTIFDFEKIPINSHKKTLQSNSKTFIHQVTLRSTKALT